LRREHSRGYLLDPDRTEREVEVLSLVARGLSNGEISLMKLGVRDRAKLIIIAYETGLVTARDPR
jgi:DNA-binding NarL/FixJ family response regulator